MRVGAAGTRSAGGPSGRTAREQEWARPGQGRAGPSTSHPITNHPSLGQVHRCQGFDVVELSGEWFKDTLWGGPSNVWIPWAYLDA
ncbi:hypothetical protein ACFXAS_35380 [Streptomyces sp. NPDC059459]|uniref:hypothetical protein n=1 Tax=Streptomyces sp. NPDC059459 TaxID=3346839 RepID=UPI0036D098F4